MSNRATEQPSNRTKLWDDKDTTNKKNSNKLFYGDNLEILRHKINSESIDLCYIDPPFNSNRTYNQIYNNLGGDEDKAQAQAFIDTWRWDERADDGFQQIIGNHNMLFGKQTIQLILGLEKILGKSNLLAYLVSMTLRIAEIHRVLKKTGSFYLHCDSTASHYLKLVLDGIFCAKGGDYLNEIIWCYEGRQLGKKKWNRKHDVILFYSKSSKYTYNWEAVAEPLKESSRKALSRFQDEQGRFYIIRYKKGGGFAPHESEETYRQLVPDAIPPKDWFVIDYARKNERLGYPTQKPELLLEKLIKASSNEGDTILDAYCGCGTTIAVAERLHRNWIGIDITYQSISLILKRLGDNFGQTALAKVELDGEPKDFDSAEALAHKKDDRVRKEFEKWLVLSYSENRAIINEKRGGDGGIDGIAFMKDAEKGKTITKEVLFSVKSDKKLNPTVIRDLFGTIKREGAAVGYLLTLYDHPNMVKESKKYGKYKNELLEKEFAAIEVISVREMFEGKKLSLPLISDVLGTAKIREYEHPELDFEA